MGSFGKKLKINAFILLKGAQGPMGLKGKFDWIRRNFKYILD